MFTPQIPSTGVRSPRWGGAMSCMAWRHTVNTLSAEPPPAGGARETKQQKGLVWTKQDEILHEHRRVGNGPSGRFGVFVRAVAGSNGVRSFVFPHISSSSLQQNGERTHHMTKRASFVVFREKERGARVIGLRIVAGSLCSHKMKLFLHLCRWFCASCGRGWLPHTRSPLLPLLLWPCPFPALHCCLACPRSEGSILKRGA